MTDLLNTPQNIQQNKQVTDYDYIITGAGCAGISLLLRIMKEPPLRNKTVLILDSKMKDNNDHTWCYWEEGYGFLEHLVHYRWQQLNFYADKTKQPLDISPYSYKMIRSLDFYDYAKNLTLKRTKVTWKKATVTEISNLNDCAYVMADGNKHTAQYVFNSILLNEDKYSFHEDNCYKLLQHFKGWTIETKQPIFNPDEATFMDFRVGQEKGAAFVYLLPTSDTKALVEYTFFNEELLDRSSYNLLLKNYLEKYWKLQVDDYTILETEIGIIPMTNHQFRSHQDSIINIGTAGGWTKASSGFTFQFIQKNTASIVAALVEEKHPVTGKGFSKRKFNLYDATLLNVLVNKKMEARDIFHKLFSKQKPQTILRFLDNETNLWEDLKILASVPASIFLPAALHELLFSSKKNKD